MTRSRRSPSSASRSRRSPTSSPRTASSCSTSAFAEAVRRDRARARPASRAPSRSPAAASLPAEIESEVAADDRGLGGERQGAAPVGGGTRRSGPVRTRRDGSAGWASPRTSSRTRSSSPRSRATCKEAGFTHVLLLGHGRLQPLRPSCSALTFGTPGRLPRAARARLDRSRPGEGRRARGSTLRGTLFIVSSKSGTTLEPNIFEQYFFERVSEAVGAQEAAKRFIAITDPGSKLEQIAERDGFRHVAHGVDVDRRALLGAVQLRHGARRRDGGRRARAARPGRADGAQLRVLRARRATTPGSLLGAMIGVCAQRAGATSSRS